MTKVVSRVLEEQISPQNTPCSRPGRLVFLPKQYLNNGDINSDGSITATDAQLAFMIVLGAYSPTYQEFCSADCNASGDVTAGDAQQIFAAALGMDECVDPI